MIPHSTPSQCGTALIVGFIGLGGGCSNSPAGNPGNGSGTDSQGGDSGAGAGATTDSGTSTTLDSGMGATWDSGTGGAGEAGSSDTSTGGPEGSTSAEGGTGMGGVLGHPDPAITYPTYPGVTLALAEEFSQPIDLDNDPIWTWSDGGLSEGSVRFTKSQITFQGGNMILTCAQTPQAASMSFAENATVAMKPLISGEFRTKYNNFRYGRYEVRLKPPTSNGNFISTLFTFRPPKDLFWREIDVELTADGPNKLGTNVYYQDNNRGGYNASFADVGSTILPGSIANNQADFHIYAIDWEPDHIGWYVDGMLIRTKNPTTNVPIPEKSAKILMNLWIFNGTGFGGTGTNTYPLSATYDWFRFYQSNAETTYPCSPTPACLAHADQIRSKNNPTDGVTFYQN